jgi:hypothetical protein
MIGGRPRGCRHHSRRNRRPKTADRRRDTSDERHHHESRVFRLGSCVCCLQTRETPRKLAPPRGILVPAVAAPKDGFRRSGRPCDRPPLTVRPKPLGKVSFRPIPTRKPFTVAPCGARASPRGERPVGRCLRPFGRRPGPFEPVVAESVARPGDEAKGRRGIRVCPPETPLGFRVRAGTFAGSRREARDTRQKTPDTRRETGGRTTRPVPLDFGRVAPDARNPEGVRLAPRPLGVLERSGCATSHCLRLPLALRRRPWLDPVGSRCYPFPSVRCRRLVPPGPGVTRNPPALAAPRRGPKAFPGADPP